jgi:hypothetical protein
MDRIGRKCFCCVTSDNTGNTTAARNIIIAAIPWSIASPDPCHFFNNTAKDLGKITYFSGVSRLESM